MLEEIARLIFPVGIVLAGTWWLLAYEKPWWVALSKHGRVVVIVGLCVGTAYGLITFSRSKPMGFESMGRQGRKGYIALGIGLPSLTGGFVGWLIARKMKGGGEG